MKAFLAWMGACSLCLVAAAPTGRAACGGDRVCVVGLGDFAVLRHAFLCVAGDACYEPRVDYDSDGLVGAKDFFYFKTLFTLAKPDVTPPRVEITSPASSRTLRGAVLISVSATDDVAVRGVEIFFEGIDAYPLPATVAPYRRVLDTRTISNGEHVIRANAYDFAGNLRSHRIPVRIDNPAPPPGGSTPGLVVVDDLDGDRRYTGQDLKIGLARCVPGCTLRALARTYDDVEIVIPAEITDAVIIEGAGIGRTVFRSPVPWTGPVVTVSFPNPLVTFRDLTIDGRKGEQISSFISTRSHAGILISNPWARDTGPGIIERVEVENMLNEGIGISGGSRWIVRHSKIHDGGCSDRFPCPGLAIIDPGALLNDPSWQSVGYGIVIESSDNTAHDNAIWNINKIGIDAYEDPSGVPPGSLPMSGFHFHHNHVHHAGSGIVSNGASGGLIENNVVTFSDGHGVVCGGPAGELVFNDNLISDSGYFGLWVSCWGPNITVANNIIGNNCRAIPGGGSGLHAHGGTRFGGGDGIRIEGNLVDEPFCGSASLIAFRNDVRISGNQFRGGRALGSLLFQDATNVVIRDTQIDGENGVPAGIFLLSNVDGMTVESDVVMTGYTRQAIIIADPGTVRNVVVE